MQIVRNAPRSTGAAQCLWLVQNSTLWCSLMYFISLSSPNWVDNSANMTQFGFYIITIIYSLIFFFRSPCYHFSGIIGYVHVKAIPWRYAQYKCVYIMERGKSKQIIVSLATRNEYEMVLHRALHTILQYNAEHPKLSLCKLLMVAASLLSPVTFQKENCGDNQLISPWTKWPPFLTWNIQMHFHVWKLGYFDLNFT